MTTKLYKTSNFSILNSHYYCLFSLLFFLCSFFSSAQDYQWQWAKSGGGSLQMQGENSANNINNNSNNGLNLEHIQDIVTDEDNNYYFLGKIGHGNSHVDGNEVPTSGSSTTGSHNILISSFACDGTYLWSRVIFGGGLNASKSAYKIVLDNNGGLYVSALTDNTVETDSSGNPVPPVCFGENNCLPHRTGDMQEYQEGYKAFFLLKYDTDNGDLLWRKDYQGEVNYYNYRGFITDLQIDSNNVLHTIIGLQDGIHLNGALTVELDEDESVKLYLVKFNSITGELIGTPLLLPLEGLLPNITTMNNTSFRYDENLNRYYLAGWRYGSGGSLVSFNGVTFGEAIPLNSNNSYAYFLSFNPDNFQDWWYREFTGSGNPQITGIAIDDNSDIYIGGKYFLGGSSGNIVAFGDYTFTENDYSGNRPYILKMNGDGEVQWSSIPTGYINPVNETANYFAYDVAINGNEVALATHGSSTIWGNFSMNRPSGHQHDPYLVRFNKQTGDVIGLHDIYGSAGYHSLTAVTADQDGNYVVGGAMRYSMFTDNPNGIPTLYNTGSGGAYTDFFMARLAATPCGTPVASNTNFERQTLRLYPNPTNGLVYIEAQDLQGYEVYNLLGQKLMSGNNEVIDLQDLSKGTYIVKVITQNGEVMTSKVIKQ